MAKLSELLSENSDKDKLFSTLKKMSLKKLASPSMAMASEPTVPPKGLFGGLDKLEFIAIDVETTGLDHKTDRVIEVGAVKFKGNEIAGQFSSLVNPEIPLPEPITRLTGITDKEVSQAPVFKNIAQELFDFIGIYPLCGHQIDFDISFLNEELKRIGRPKLSVPEIDTALLSRIILPAIERYSLKHVAHALEVNLDNAHRALADAKASGQIACSLFLKIDKIPIHARSIMARFAPASFLKNILFKSLSKAIPVNENEICRGAVVRKQQKKLRQTPPPSDVSLDAVGKIFGSGGSLAEVIKNYSERSSQKNMALCVMEAFNAKTFLVAEAGTGTGKSFAYLIPAALYALKNNLRILVSTHTRNLQDQLHLKDLPVVKKIAGADFRFSVLKGRSNYLCLRRYFLLLSGNLMDLSYRERMGVLPLIRWANETKTGDIEEQNQFNIKWFSRIWRSICADARLCAGKQCNEYNRCFLQNARMHALDSHIVIINHSLFYSEICSESSFLGPLGPCIFDEAHHLESCGHKHLRVEVDTNRLMQYVDDCASTEKEIRKSIPQETLKTNTFNFKSTIKRLRSEIRAFLDTLNSWIQSLHPQSTDFQIGFKENAFSPFGNFAGLIQAFAEAQNALNDLVQTCDYEEKPEKDELLRPQIRLLIDKTSQLKFDLNYVIIASTENHVFWIEGNQKKGWVKLCGVALDIGSILSILWEQNTYACIFTSATLSVAHSMDYFKRKIGLIGVNETKTRCEFFESPFHPEQALYCSLLAAPDPDTEEYPVLIADVLSSLMTTFQKNILVLFTSLSMLDSVYSSCKNLPFSDQFGVLGQGISGNRQAILDEFKNSRPCVLLGADSFWEGIDMPGSACEIVVIARLPFQIPTHPLTKAIAERIQQQDGESFFSYSVPEAIIKFRQGTGRLIRDYKDRGALLVLDNRIFTKNYGKRFRESLDGEMKAYATMEELLIGFRDFFTDNNQPGTSSLRYVPFEEA